MNLYLIGYRGSGKSTVGQLLGQRADWPVIDSDDEIERLARRSIRLQSRHISRLGVSPGSSAHVTGANAQTAHFRNSPAS